MNVSDNRFPAGTSTGIARGHFLVRPIPEPSISNGVAVSAQLLNLLGLGFQPQFAAYFLGLVLLLLVAATQFARILFARPE